MEKEREQLFTKLESLSQKGLTCSFALSVQWGAEQLWVSSTAGCCSINRHNYIQTLRKYERITGRQESSWRPIRDLNFARLWSSSILSAQIMSRSLWWRNKTVLRLSYAILELPETRQDFIPYWYDCGWNSVMRSTNIRKREFSAA